MQKLCIFIFAVLISGLRLSNGQRRFMHTSYQDVSYCQTPLGDAGMCVSLKFCPEVLTLFTKLETNSAKQYSMALQRLCGNRITPDQYPVVCCKRAVTTTIPKYDESLPPITETPVTTTTTTTTTTAATTTSPTISTTTTATANKTIISPERICSTPNSTSGLCKPLKECPLLLDQLTTDPHNEELKGELRKSHDSCGNENTIICCPLAESRIPSATDDNNPIHQLPSEDDGCGLVNQTTPKIVGGEESQIGAWPWMALIGYDPYSVRPFKCGGSLISARHVITAAHCIRQDLSFVRLGEFDLSIESETRHVDINVIKHTKHPLYGKNRRSDLAILLLETTVQFTDLIAPICMPNSVRLRSKSYVDSMPFVAGWGYTQQGGSGSHVLKQAQLPVLDNEICRRIYTQLNPTVSSDEYDESIICAGYTIGGSDTCQGDSGGPLMIPELYKGITRYYLIGIVSYGRGCGKVPGIYISTQHWMDWILEQISSM